MNRNPMRTMTDKTESKSSHQIKNFEPDPDSSRLKSIALVGFIILIIGILIVVLILPAQLAKRNERIPDITGVETAGSDGLVSSEHTAIAKEVGELLDEILESQARLENDGIGVWGVKKLATSYDEVLSLLEQADDDRDRQHYDQALENYRAVKEKLEQLRASRPERAKNAMESGDEAFQRLDSQSAIDQYTIAVAAEPDSTEARARLARAENLSQVLDLIAAGEQHERDGQLALARQKYSEAVLLDKEFQPAQEHFQKLDAVISDSKFSVFMSEAESALKQKDIPKAKAALKSAQDLNPNAPGVNDLEQQINNIALFFDFQLLGQKALAHEMAEEWSMAAEIYNSILKMDANAGFAQEGKQRVENILALTKGIQNYLSDPNDLLEPEQISHARALYELSASMSDAGPKFHGQAEKLHVLLAEYSKPVSVLVVSDGLTSVTIYRVGQLGQFDEQSLKLQPGRYKAVGTRSGYRDVHIPFTVPVGGEEITVEAICKEQI